MGSEVHATGPHGKSTEAERLRLQARALAHFGGHALRTHDLDALLQEAAAMVSDCIGVDLVKVLELLPDGDTLLIRAGVNWKPGVVGHATFGAHEKSPGGYALGRDEPSSRTIPAARTASRSPPCFRASRQEHGQRGDPLRAGSLGRARVDFRQRKSFNEDDVSFLQNYANLFAAAIDRLQTEANPGGGRTDGLSSRRAPAPCAEHASERPVPGAATARGSTASPPSQRPSMPGSWPSPAPRTSWPWARGRASD